MTQTDFQPWMDAQFNDYVSHLETLVNLDSGSYLREGVALVLNWVAVFLSTDGFEVQRRDMAGAQHDRLAARAVDDGRFDADLARAAVEDQWHTLAQLFGNVFHRGRADAPEAVG